MVWVLSLVLSGRGIGAGFVRALGHQRDHFVGFRWWNCINGVGSELSGARQEEWCWLTEGSGQPTGRIQGVSVVEFRVRVLSFAVPGRRNGAAFVRVLGNQRNGFRVFRLWNCNNG